MLKTSTILWCAGGIGVVAALVVGAIMLMRTPDHYGHLVPAETVVYVRIQDLGTFKDRVLGEGNLKNPEPIQTELDRQYNEALVSIAEGLKAASSEDFDRLVKATGTVHLAVWLSVEEPAKVDYSNINGAWIKPQAVVFIEIKDTDALTELAGKMEDQITPRMVGDEPGYDLSKPLGMKDPVVGYFMGSVFVVGSESAVLQVMKADGGGLEESLADNPRFTRAFDEWAGKGDFFAFLDVQGVAERFEQQYDRQLARVPELPSRDTRFDEGLRRAPESPKDTEEDTDRPRAKERIEDRRADTMKLFGAVEEYGYAAVSFTADGRLSARVYAAEGKEIPAYMQRPSRVNELTKRIPENAVFMMCSGYDGGESTRKSFTEYLNEKTGAGIAPSRLSIPVPVADQLKVGLETLEEEVVMMVDDYWLAVLPVKSEFAVVVAPDDKGAYGAVAVFDWENREQVDKLHAKLFQFAERAELPWKETTHEGLAIRYLDLAEMLTAAGDRIDGETRDMLSCFQLQLGYAVGDTYCYAGSVELIKRLHTPSGRSIHDAINYEGVDEENALIWCLNFGAFVHGPKTGIKAVDDFRETLSEQVPEDAMHVVTVTATAEHITLRSNIPTTALAAWVLADRDALTTPTIFNAQTRDAKRAEGEQLLGSARDYARVQYARSGEAPAEIPARDLGMLKGTYFVVRSKVYLKEGTEQGALAADPVGTSPAGYGLLAFSFTSGRGDVQWFSTQAARDAELEAFVKPD